MKNVSCVSAAIVAALAGSALAQPAIDGQLDDAYGSPLYVNTANPTGFGDNSGGGGCNESDIGNPGGVTSGIEFMIPLSAIGNPAGAVRVMAFLNNGGHSSATNQVLPALPGPGAAALGNARAINFASISGTQFATVNPAAGTSPAIDGNLDTVYGSALALQASRTTAGDDTDASNATAGGSELDGLYAVIRNGNLYVMLTGNMKSDFGSKIELFIDSTAGGFNQLSQSATLPNVDFDALQNMQGNGTDAGLTFDAGFTADYYFTFGAGNDPVTYFPNIADLNAGASGGAFLGCNEAGNGSGVLGGCGGPPANGVEIALDNGNAAGVGATCPPPNGDRDTATGSEIDNVYARICGDSLYVFIGGNLETSFNKLSLFIDSIGSDGQNPLAANNVDIDFNGLNRQGGLIFDGDFVPDHWLSFTNGNNPVEVYNNSAVLRADGPRGDINGLPYDYGAYHGGPKSANFPNKFNGPRIDVFGGTSIFTEYSPRLAGDSCFANPSSPVGTPDQIETAIDNSNIGGVTSTGGSGAGVNRGFEFRITLAELGWDGAGPIKLGGYISNGGYDFLSNQVIGGIDAGAANLGDPAFVDFGAINGSQYVTVPCPADYNGDGFVSGDDFDAFVSEFELGGPGADFNCDGFVSGDDFDAYVVRFETGC